MNRTLFALFVALLIHFLFFLLYLRIEKNVPEIKHTSPKERKIKISLRDLPLSQVPKPLNQIKQEVELIPVIPKVKELKKTPVIFKAKKIPIKPKLNPKPKQKIVKLKVPKTKPLAPIKPYIPFIQERIIKVTKKENTSDMSWITEDKSSEIVPNNVLKKSLGASAGRNIKKLYGDDFKKLSQGQQKYIINNQEIMRRITQEVLNRQASVSNIQGLNVNKSNVIEFYLHPNGDMSDFKFLKQSGYFILDDITKSTIEYAYAKYPRPTEKTLIRYNVFYNLLRH